MMRMLKIFDEKDQLVAQSNEAVKIDPNAWCFCIWCHPKGDVHGHPNNTFHQRWDYTELTRICVQCEHEETI